MDLYVLRHGLAVERGTPGYARDADRPLTGEGKRKLTQIIKAVKRLELWFDLILSSPYLRAAQTAELVAKGLRARNILRYNQSLTPQGSPRKLIELLQESGSDAESVLLVGHEPYLSQLISLLLTGGSNLSFELKKGGLCKLTAESLKAGRCATLHWVLTPKQMGLIA